MGAAEDSERVGKGGQLPSLPEVRKVPGAGLLLLHLRDVYSSRPWR